MTGREARFVLEMICPALEAKPRPAPPPADEAGWREALALAQRLHAEPAFLVGVTRRGIRPPPDVARAHERVMTRERMRLALLDHELMLSLELLARERIPVILFKGMDLGRRFYADRMLRPMTDADLLVPERAYDGAVQSLRRAGFRLVGDEYPGRFRTELSRDGTAPVVELHRQLVVGDGMGRTRALWDRSLSGAFPDLPGDVSALARADYVPYLIRHAAVQHLIESPMWLNDIHLVVSGPRERKEPLDWAFVVSELRRARATSAGWLVLGALERYWGTPLPSDVMAALSKSVAPLRRALLAALRDPVRLFHARPHGWLWTLGARALLKDDVASALTHLLERRVRLKLTRPAESAP